ncbi:MAG: hypothetical protein KAS32_18375 [Candidatus Peribacteraceae bacterium]|nr:hypothetical protein [Candidatus Peribacteraceae bacterium]
MSDDLREKVISVKFSKESFTRYAWARDTGGDLLDEIYFSGGEKGDVLVKFHMMTSEEFEEVRKERKI